MHRSPLRQVTALALGLAAGSVPMAARTAPPLSHAQQVRQASFQPARVAHARANLLSQKSQLGLGSRDGFATLSAFTNDQGQTIVRLNQTYDGYRVWGTQALAHVLPDGAVETLTDGLKAGIDLQAGPRLSGQQAIEAALRNLAPKGPMPVAPEVERVVFPARYLGGLATTTDIKTGHPVLDRKLTVHARLAAPYVWAYEVRTSIHNDQDGAHELVYIIDGTTGNILRVNDLAQHLAAPTPVQGTGNGYYRGTVTLNTSQMADGTYALYDTSRGTLPNPYLQYFTPDGSGWSATGLQVWWEQHSPSGVSSWNTYLFQSNPTNTWGDGQPWGPSWGQENGANGQTAGVDAMSAMTTTWDFYKNVFGRNGLDGQGTSVFASVLSTGFANIDGAWWSISGKGVYLGAGSYPTNPNGHLSMTDLDIVAHELTHGVTSPSYAQAWVGGAGYEEAGLNEATSDFFAQMVKAYTTRPTGADSAIPNTGADWEEGAGVNRGTPIRWLDHPSKDQRSVDGWYDGIQYMDGHYSSGPLNRALYFLAQGSSSTQGDGHYSPFLPGGMTGIGNDSAARIWYKTVTENLLADGTGSITYAQARTAAIAAADSLYGAGSPQEAAVESAFAAANVGEAPGQAPRVLISFAPWRNGDYIQVNHYGNAYANRQIFPKSETVFPRISVQNTADTSVTWSLGGPSMYNGSDYSVEEGGVINSDGSWTTPNRMSWHSITATSHADVNQFAEGRVFLINMDTDMDLETDAVDMAGVAYSWYLSNALNPAHSVFEAPWVDDADVSFFVDAMRSTWPVK
ncbi:MAG TPA: M4 family metallopeptidase [Holophagaceae bacterium]|jgi:Zn-dependent metalloprotease|nr:M4 family metallopeptidase [Holophagaceae bacterium]